MRVDILKKGEMVRESDMHKSTERMWWWDRHMFPWVGLVKYWISLIVTRQYLLISCLSQWKWGYYCWNVWRLVSTQYTLFDFKISCIFNSCNEVAHPIIQIGYSSALCDSMEVSFCHPCIIESYPVGSIIHQPWIYETVNEIWKIISTRQIAYTCWLSEN